MRRSLFTNASLVSISDQRHNWFNKTRLKKLYKSFQSGFNLISESKKGFCTFENILNWWRQWKWKSEWNAATFYKWSEISELNYIFI